MKVLGGILIAIGILLLLYALFLMDTSVYASGVGYVNNIGLMSQKQNMVIASCAIILFGLIMVIVPSFKTNKAPASENIDTKKCPQCAELIKKEAKICRFCNYKFTDEELKNIQQKEVLIEEDNTDYMKLTIAQREEIMDKYGIKFDSWDGKYIYKDFKSKTFKEVLNFARRSV